MAIIIILINLIKITTLCLTKIVSHTALIKITILTILTQERRHNVNNGLYIFTWSILGEEAGSQGGAAAFEGRIIVMEEDGGVRVNPLDMYSGLSGKSST